MKRPGRKRILKGWILLLTLCSVAWVAADIFLTGGKKDGRDSPRLIDSPVELYPQGGFEGNTQDSIANVIKYISDHDKKHSG